MSAEPSPSALAPRHGEIVRALLADGPLSRAELVAATGTSRAVLGVLLDELSRADWIEVADRVAPGPMGRPIQKLRFRTESALVFALDIGRRLRGTLLSLTGHVLCSGEASVSIRDDIDIVLQRALALRDRLLERACVADAGARQILRVVIGITAGVDGSRATRHRDVHPSWRGTDLAATFRSLGDDVLVENDANLAALGLAEPGETVLAITVGEGIGTGLVIAGALHRGRSGLAGQLGYLRAAASLPAIVGSDAVAGIDPTELIRRLDQRCTDRDPQAVEAVHEVGVTIGQAVSMVVAVAAVDRIAVWSGRNAIDGELVAGMDTALRASAGDEVIGVVVQTYPDGPLPTARGSVGAATASVFGPTSPWTAIRATAGIRD